MYYVHSYIKAHILQAFQIEAVSGAVFSSWAHESNSSLWAGSPFSMAAFQVERNLGLYCKSLHFFGLFCWKFLLQCGRWCHPVLLRLSGFWNLTLQGSKEGSAHPPWPCVTWWLCCVCSMPSVLVPRSPMKSLGYGCGRELILFSFSFHFPAACHRSDSHPANSALDSFLQTGTTNSPVREQSERKMKNNIRKEPFGKLNKKCYIKINTGAWPFVVLYILKPPIDFLLITCLFYFTDTSLERL